SGRPTTPTLPFVLECESSSQLPAVGPFPWGRAKLLLSQASQIKRMESREARQGLLWSGWIEFLKLPRAGREDLRPRDAETIGEYAQRRGYVGLVYADGNAMGRLVKELNSRDVCTAFSELVDGSIRQACYEALSQVCAVEIASAHHALAGGRTP